MQKTFQSFLLKAFSGVFLLSVLFGGCAKPYKLPDIDGPEGTIKAARLVLQGDVTRKFPDRVNIDDAFVCDSFGVMLGRDVCPSTKEGENPEALRLQTYVRPGEREIELIWAGGELPNRQGAPLDIHRSFKREFKAGFVYHCGIATLFCTETPVSDAGSGPDSSQDEAKSMETSAPAEAAPTPMPPPTPPVSMGCRNDMDCKGERICEKGVCVYPPVWPEAPKAE